MKILIENSTWNNIGDGFYQSALYCMMKDLYPNDEVLMEEGPVHRAFRPKKDWQTNNMFRLWNYQTADVHVFSGPMIASMMVNYKDKIIDIINRGNKYAFISVSSAGISDVERNKVRDFFEKYPPIFFSSRDEETYENFKDYVPNAYNGICTAFLVKHYLPIDSLDSDFKFFISTFYTELEPTYTVKGDVNIENVIIKRKPTTFGLKHRYSRHLDFLNKNKQSKLKDHAIVRVRQDLSTHFKHIKFSHPNSFMSFNLLSYLALYKSADFTISDRVHSCAVSLALGKPARFLFETPRAGIFNRLDFDYKANNGIMYPNLKIIDTELEKLKKEIVKAI